MPAKPDEVRNDVPLSKITFSSQYHPRIENSDHEKKAIVKYTEALKSGVALPPIKVVEVGDTLWCFDGFLRKSAYYQIEPNPKVTVEVYKGEWKDFLRFTGAVNRELDPNGVQRTTEDIKKVVHNILDNDELGAASVRQIITWSGYNNPVYISKYRKPIVNHAPLPFVAGDVKPLKNPTTTQGVGEHNGDKIVGKFTDADASLRDAGIYHDHNELEYNDIHGSEIEVIDEVIIKNKINTILDVFLMKNPHYKSRDEINLAICLKHIGEI